ncbi:tetratricopeptide repeat protein [Lacibacter luteus]|uniref:Tetratricopeptide repeat protein n=1 Tax=Lacibacter luteus TaxID=2508719 RepID=A0A4Q1CG47_9BACT|nr:tetratricopeptide repeat protein [Lacibacter luteus]RXK58887.1 tetratricopeptide repeat protein [Lacibacter luteus]
MWQLAGELTNSKPDEALLLTQRSLLLAQKIKYVAGESRALAVLANTFLNLGNYPKALEYNLQRLKIEEKRNIPINLTSVLINTGIVYVMEEDYETALLYYRKSDSVMQLHKVTDYEYNINVNKGDVFDKLNRLDSAYRYYYRSLIIARDQQNDDFIGASMTGLAHYYRKTNQFDSSLHYYHNAIMYLQKANDDLITCEATLGLAKLYNHYQVADSALYYASYSNSIAGKSGFVSEQLKSSDFLKTFYREQKNIDSAFYYYNTVLVLNDSINNKNRLRDIQFITINEQMRQVQIEEEKLAAKEERRQQLQLLFISIFIPGFFLLTLLLSKVRIPIRFIKVMGILSLLIFFEFLTLLLHPTVKELTHHTPVFEMMIFVAIAAVLIPAHHRFEHWLINWLVNNREALSGGEKKIRIKQSKIKLQLNPDERDENAD